MTWTVEMVTAPDGAQLRAGVMESATAHATCLFLPGLGDFLEKRTPPAISLAAAGHRVVSLDWRGQGGSGRYGYNSKAAHTKDFRQYASDAKAVLDYFTKAETPVWYLGYSMGATVALDLAVRHPPRALVLVSPMLAFPMPERLIALSSMVAQQIGFERHFAPGEAKGDLMGAARGEVSDPVARQWLRDLQRSHPDLTITGTTWGWVKAAITAMRTVRRIGRQDIECPVLFALADDERSVDPKAIHDLSQRLDARLIQISGGHDLFLTTGRSRTNLLHEIKHFVADVN